LASGDELVSGDERFTSADLTRLADHVADVWASASDRDWSAQAGTVEWSCLQTADHAVDCVYAPAFFLASRRRDDYPDVGTDLTMGAGAEPARLAESLLIASRLLAGVVNDAEPDVRAVIFRFPEVLVAPPVDFAPRGAMELILHAHDVCTGLGLRFEPDAELCRRLREHTRPWPMWTVAWDGLACTDDPWGDLLRGSGRARATAG
jgi:hypothetical protein